MKNKEMFIYLKKNWHYFKNYKKKLYFYFGLHLTFSAINALLPIFNAKLVTSITNNVLEQVLYFAILYFIIDFASSGIGFLIDSIFNKFYGRIILDIRKDICQNILELEIKEFDNNGSGVFTKRIEEDARDLGYIFTSINNALSSVLTNIGIFVLIFFINTYIGLFYILGVIIIFFVQKARIKKRNVIHKEYRAIGDKNSGVFNELIRGVRDIKVLNINEFFIDRTVIELEESYQQKYKLDMSNQSYWLLDSVVRKILRLLFIILGVYLVKQHSLIVANFLVLFMYQDKLFALVNSFSELAGDLKDFNLAASRVFEIIDGTAFKKEQFGQKKIKKVKGDIVFDDVTFAYDENNAVLNNMSFKINANETIAFVGKSGGGKTTIFSLLTKLYNVENGKILIDNTNIKDLSRDTIRNNISIIVQNPYIFNLSIRDNLLLVNPSLTEKEMIEKCKIACLHDYVMSLYNQYDTKIGEGGVTLSGGQKQRLAIARALIKNSEIILFDEATSALDNETQKEIRQAIKNISKHNTILIIAHRLSTVIDCDRILVVDGGKIVASGKHEELLNSNLLYKTLYLSNFE